MIQGMNYGDGASIYNDSYNSSLVNAQLAEIKQYFSHIRISHVPYNGNANHIANARLVCLAAKALGFHVVWGITSNGTTLTSSNYSDFATACGTQAAWCKANGIDEFACGNEEELRVDNTTLTYAQFRTNQRTTFNTVKNANAGLAISYAVEASSYAAWISEGIGVLDYFSINSYGYNDEGNIYNLAKFRNDTQDVVTAFGAKAYVSEYNIATNWSLVTPLSDAAKGIEIANRRAILKDINPSRAYFYTWANDDNDEFACKLQSGDYSRMFPAALGQRTWFTGVPNVAFARGATPSRAATPERAATPDRGVI